MQAFTARFVPFMQFIPPMQQNSAQGFAGALQGLFLKFAPFYNHRYQTDTSGYNTARATLDSIPAPGRAQPIPDTRRHAGRCTGQHNRPIQPPYYNKVYKGAAAHRLLWIHARQCNISQTMPARRGSPATRDAAGGAEPLAATAASLFGLSPDSQ